MAWRKITRADFAATLSEAEIRAFGQSDDYTENTIEQLVENTVSTVRGFILSGRRCRVSPDLSTLPDMLVSPAMDYAAYNLLKRYNRNPNEARTRAYERANALFDKIAAGDVVPEDFDAADPMRPVAAAPAFSPPRPARLLD